MKLIIVLLIALHFSTSWGAVAPELLNYDSKQWAWTPAQTKADSKSLLGDKFLGAFHSQDETDILAYEFPKAELKTKVEWYQFLRKQLEYKSVNKLTDRLIKTADGNGYYIELQILRKGEAELVGIYYLLNTDKGLLLLSYFDSRNSSTNKLKQVREFFESYSKIKR